MLDVTSTNQATITGPARRAEPSAAISGAADGNGRNAPNGGTTLPVNGARQSEPVELQDLERLAESISRFVKSMNRDLSFSVHEASGHTVVTVLDGETKEVIRQIPSEEFLRMSEALANSTSVLLDTEA